MELRVATADGIDLAVTDVRGEGAPVVLEALLPAAAPDFGLLELRPLRLQLLCHGRPADRRGHRLLDPWNRWKPSRIEQLEWTLIEP